MGETIKVYFQKQKKKMKKIPTGTRNVLLDKTNVHCDKPCTSMQKHTKSSSDHKNQKEVSDELDSFDDIESLPLTLRKKLTERRRAMKSKKTREETLTAKKSINVPESMYNNTNVEPKK